MQNAAQTSRFLIDLSSEREFADSGIVVSHIKLLQDAVVSQFAYAANSRQVFNGLAHRLIQLAEHSFGMRDMDSLEEASLVLLNLPIAEARKIGKYYQALAVRRSGKIDESLPLLEAVADRAPRAYRARALQTLGAIYHAKGRLDEALRLYPEARRAASLENGRDLLTTLLVSLDTSCIKSEMGDHRGALADYEKLSPLVQIVARQNPLYFYLYHNELAIEFAELDRLAEAEAASAIALASPFACAYPEWTATRDEIAAKRTTASSSIVAIQRARRAKPATQAEPRRTPKPSKVVISGRPANTFGSFQRSTIGFPARARIDFNAMNVLDRVLACIGPRAPPAFSRMICPPISERILESAEGKLRAAQNQADVQWVCAKPYCLLTSNCIDALLCSLNYLSRGPPVGGNVESEANWLNRFALVPSLRRVKASNPQHFHNGVLDRRPEINPHRQLNEFQFQRIRLVRRPCASLPTLSVSTSGRHSV